MPRKIEMAGRRFGRLLVLEHSESVLRFGRRQIFWLCRCDCGVEKWTLGAPLRDGRTKSCGCFNDEQTAKHREAWRLTRPPSKFPDKHSRQAAYWAENKERLTKQHREWLDGHEDEMRAYRAAFWVEHKERLTAKHREWERLNPGKLRANVIRRKFRQQQRTPTWVNHDALNEIYRNCPSGMDVDHIVPLKGKTIEGYLVSGLHVPWNLQYLTPAENNRKRNRMRNEDHDITG